MQTYRFEVDVNGNLIVGEFQARDDTAAVNFIRQHLVAQGVPSGVYPFRLFLVVLAGQLTVNQPTANP